jgi:hypothetical protein
MIRRAILGLLCLLASCSASAFSRSSGSQLGDWRWRIANLYYITNEKGECVKFTPKPEQLDAAEHSMDGWNLILKARQLGFTTLIDLFALDQAFFVDDLQAAIIAHERQAVEDIFRNKVKYPYERLPQALRDWNPARNDTANMLVFVNAGARSAWRSRCAPARRSCCTSPRWARSPAATPSARARSSPARSPPSTRAASCSWSPPPRARAATSTTW